MERKFKSLTTKKEVDLISYLQQQFIDHEDIKIYVGTDSQSRGASTLYAVVIVLHYGNHGAHVLYSKELTKRVYDSFSRLWKEVEISIEISEYLRNSGIQKPEFIDIDFNPDPKYKSNAVLRASLGYIESMGYKPRFKPDGFAATYCADKICK